MLSKSTLFILLFFPSFAWCESGCLLLKENVSAEGVTESTVIPFTKGRILPFSQYNPITQKFLIKYRDIEYWMPGQSVKVGSANLCSQEAKCFVSNKVENIYQEPNSESPTISKSIPNQKLIWSGTTRKNDVQWIQVEIGDNFGWIISSAGETRNWACPKSENARKPQFSFSFEAGAEASAVTKNYETAISPIPKPDEDVEYSYTDPFYTQIKPGSGYFFAGVLGVDLKDKYRIEGGVGYSSYKYVMITYDNPSNYNGPPDTSTSIPFSSLKPRETELKETYVLFPLGFYLKLGGDNRWSMKLGLRGDFLYTLSPPFEYFYYSGLLTKRQMSEKFYIGPGGLQTKQSLELRPQYKFSNGTELALVYRYSTWSSHTISIWTEF